MKRTIIYVGMALLAVVSCSRVEQPGQFDDDIIRFTVSSPDALTKAGSPKAGPVVSDSKLYIYAFYPDDDVTVFADEALVSSESVDGYGRIKYNDPCYFADSLEYKGGEWCMSRHIPWPDSAGRYYSLNFIAISNVTRANMGKIRLNGKKTTGNGRLYIDADNLKLNGQDLLITRTAGANKGSSVDITLQHTMSRVTVSATNNSDSCSIVIRGVRVYSKGDYADLSMNQDDTRQTYLKSNIWKNYHQYVYNTVILDTPVELHKSDSGLVHRYTYDEDPIYVLPQDLIMAGDGPSLSMLIQIKDANGNAIWPVGADPADPDYPGFGWSNVSIARDPSKIPETELERYYEGWRPGLDYPYVLNFFGLKGGVGTDDNGDPIILVGFGFSNVQIQQLGQSDKSITI